MDVKAALSMIVRLFFVFTVAIMMFMNLQGLIFFHTSPGWHLCMQYMFLYRIALVGFVSAAPVILLVHRKERTRIQWLLQQTLHAVVTATLVFGSLIRFGWLNKDALWMYLLFFAFMYILGNTLLFLHTRRLAQKLTKQLQIFQQESRKM